MSSEQEARDLQRAIENSLAPVSLGSARSTPDSGWTDRPPKRSRTGEAPRAPRQATDPRDSEAVDPADHSLRVAAAKFLDTGMVRQRVGTTLYSALDRFRREDTPDFRAKSRLAPKVERWDEGLELYRRGALRMTRTPGRRRANAPNCISLDDLVKAPAMLRMYSNTFLLEFDLIAPLLPILDHPHASRPVPIFLGQPLFADPFLHLACYHCGIDPPTGRDRPRAAQETVLAPALTSIYQRVVGRNLFMIHPKCSGCSHSKVFLVRYPGFVLLVIASANTMQLDMELCDNHWYIQAFPELTPDQASQKKTKRASTEFEQMLFCHLNELECPTEFISLLEDYDYSLASDLHLVVSQPGVVSPHEFDSRSIGRLATIARACIPTRERDQVEFEVCCGSVGAMSDGWLTSVDWLLRGKDPKKLAKRMAESATLEIASDTSGTHGTWKKRRRDHDEDVRGVDVGAEAHFSGWKIVFPPKDYVATLSDEVKLTASNISSYWKTANWSQVPSRTKDLFHQYVSKERGRLFHEKCILWLRAPSASSRSAPSSAPSTSAVPSSSPPHLVYIGSHNFSAAAWGTPELSKDRTRLKAKGPTNYEIGIVVEGDRIASMLERGSTWEDIVTYERPVEKFGPDDIPWVSPAWATSREE